MREIKIIAHRGASVAEPENSMAAFEKALAMGAHVIEMDVRTTRDGIPIIMHDDTVDRTTNGRGKVADMTLSKVEALRLRNGEPVPTLAGVLERFGGRCTLNLELKDAGAAARSCKLVKSLSPGSDVIFSSFHGPWLVELKLVCKDARVAFISDDRSLDCVRIATSLKAEAINISTRIATRKLILEAHETGLDANVWVVNSSWKARKFIGLGADGLITDKPDMAARMLG